MRVPPFQLCKPASNIYKRACFILSLSSGQELPGLQEQGHDVLDDLPFDEFQHGLRSFRGEIKGILTRGRFIAGIGNAYADEILFAAGISPFRKARSFGEDEVRVLYQKCRDVVADAIDVLRQRMREDIHIKIRDFLEVHN